MPDKSPSHEETYRRRYSSKFPLLPGERRVRFVCGAAAGAVLGFLGSLQRLDVRTWSNLTLHVALAALAIGLLAAWAGDRLWQQPHWWWVAGLLLAALWWL